MLSYLIVGLFASTLVDAAPHKSKNKKYDGPQLVYDQKQTGDYNIQLHLKDFQIIAMLGDDILGDYDYNYDYADFTIKPSGSTSTSTTLKPASSSPPPSTTEKELPPSTSQLPLSTSSAPVIVPSIPSTSNSSSPEKPSSFVISNAHPYPIEVIVPQPTNNPEEEVLNVKQKKVVLLETADSPSGSTQDDKNGHDLTLETTLNLISNSKPPSTSENSSGNSTTDKRLSYVTHTNPINTVPPVPQQSSLSSDSPPGKIKVQILGTPSGNPSKQTAPLEGAQEEADGNVLQSELASYRKCSSGYARDKRGRCRRVRRPGISSQLPFGFSRLASNLATRLRLTPHENPAVTSISTE